MSRNAVVYYYKDRYLISPLSRTTAGVLVGEEPAVALDGDTATDEFGRELLAALRRCRDGVTHPTDWTGITHRFLAATGAKSWAALTRASSSVLIREVNGEITITPQARDESGVGFVELRDQAVTVAASRPDALGRIAEEKLRHSIS